MGRKVCSHIAQLMLLSLLFVSCANMAQNDRGPDNIVFQDDFADPLTGSWQLEADAQGRAEIVDGKLLLTINAPATAQYVTLEDQVFSNFIVDVDATQVGGVAGGSYGLLVRMVAPGQFYRFEVTSNGEYVVERHDGPGSWQRLTDGWQESEAILPGTNQTNQLRVAVAGGTFSFYANETLLVQVVDGTYGTGAVALDAGTFNQGELQVAFDNLVVWLP